MCGTRDSLFVICLTGFIEAYYYSVLKNRKQPLAPPRDVKEMEIFMVQLEPVSEIAGGQPGMTARFTHRQMKR